MIEKGKEGTINARERAKAAVVHESFAGKGTPAIGKFLGQCALGNTASLRDWEERNHQITRRPKRKKQGPASRDTETKGVDAIRREGAAGRKAKGLSRERGGKKTAVARRQLRENV